jgi:choline kinase
MTTAVILAAGLGSRLGYKAPKCLTRVGSTTLLARYIAALEAVRVERLIVVTPRESVIVQDALIEMNAPCWAAATCTPYSTKGALSSFDYALELLDGPLLVMDGDVLFPICALSRLLESGRSALLLDTTKAATGEEMMAGLDSGGLVGELGRDLQGEWSRVGESLGLAFLDRAGVRHTRKMVERLRDARESSFLEWEAALSMAAQGIPICGALADKLPWVEIDFPSDVEAAGRLVHAVDSLDQLYLKGNSHDR